jgi:hypothetical protein
MSAFQNELFKAEQSIQVEAEFISFGCAHETGGLSQFDMIDQLIGTFRQREQAIDATKAFIDNAFSKGVMSYFIDGMALSYGPEYRFSLPSDSSAAKACLRVEFWNRLLNEAQIFDLMPAAKREVAHKQFSGLDCPAFDETTVRPTMESLLAQRSEFFAQRVDGIFQGLSKSHVTNQPSGFSKKMILNYVFDKDGYLGHQKAALISDLRGVVGRLTGRGEPSEHGTRKLLARIYSNSIGKKVAIDGGAFFVTLYKAGTAHFEVAPEVAIELNSILATLYPLAIPSQFRTQPKAKKVGSFDLKTVRLPMGVIDLLSSMERRGHSYSIYLYAKALESVDQTIKVLDEVGASVTRSSDKSTIFVHFDYDPVPVMDQIIFTGVVPEQTSYQFYATRSVIGLEAAALLGVHEGLNYCEPSAGVGDLAQYLPKESTTCIELAQVRAKVLEAKGYKAIQADFLEWAALNKTVRFDGILMNPPFSLGRANAHLQAAASLLPSDGRLVAILPASMAHTHPLECFEHVWSQVYTDQFEGTAVRVVILTAQRAN